MTAGQIAVAFDHVDKDFRAFASPIQLLKEALHPARKRYSSSATVLRDVSFQIPAGQTVAVLGPNGVGKSTLLHLMAGLVEPSAGKISVGGSVHGLFELGGGFAPELTGRENARFFHDVILEHPGDAHEREHFVEAFADIGEYFDRPVRTYSTGMFLRLAFAMTISAEPDILLLDEVVAVGDARFQQKCFRRLSEMRERGTTIVIVTHAAELMTGLCDRLLLLDRGELVFDGDPVAGVERYFQLFLKAPSRPSSEGALDRSRFGEGGATIQHSFASIDGKHELTHFQRGQRVKLIMEVVFDRAVAAPQFGFSCSTQHGVRLYTASTLLQGLPPPAAVAGEHRRIEISFDLLVAVSDLFVDLSVFEMGHGSATVLDARMSTLHLHVSSVMYCDGLVDLDAKFVDSATRESVMDGPLMAARLPT